MGLPITCQLSSIQNSSTHTAGITKVSATASSDCRQRGSPRRKKQNVRAPHPAASHATAS